MDRAKVIVHMYVSIDSKIDGPRASAISSAYYSDELFQLSSADGTGRPFKCTQHPANWI